MDNISILKIILFSLLLSITFAGCSKEDKEGDIIAPPNTIANLIENSKDYSSLNAALIITNLKPVFSGSEEFTIFAPNNAAFNSFLSINGYENLKAVPVEVLTQVILYHVISEKLANSDLSSGYLETASKISPEENNLSLYINVEDNILINGHSLVTANMVVENGTILGVNNVLNLPDISTFLDADPNFEIFFSAMSGDDSAILNLLKEKDEQAPFTLFAPSNEAFEDLWDELGVENFEEISEENLHSLLSHHIIPGVSLNSDELKDAMVLSSLENKVVTISAASKLSISDESGRVSNITKTDIQATNGVIHIIDKVLLSDNKLME